MRLGSFALLLSVLVTTAFPAVAASHKRRGPTSTRVSSKHVTKPRILGQRTIDDGRATQIQTALIKARYLSGEPSGHWDAQSQTAMVKLQADNGWQTKLVPDSRALIKLGLGPDSIASASSPLTPGTPNAPNQR
jgi:hypothetical protein